MIGRILHLLSALITATLLFAWWITTPNRRLFWLLNMPPTMRPKKK